LSTKNLSDLKKVKIEGQQDWLGLVSEAEQGNLNNKLKKCKSGANHGWIEL
jgi:hypothetical protein